MSESYHIFGVRHLSPGASFHLIRFLEEKRPKCILIEGPSDASVMIQQIASSAIRPPIALMAYTVEFPIETVLYPFARYSPEYQAIRWGIKKKKEVRFIDLPSDALLCLKQSANENQGTVGDFYEFSNKLYEQLASAYEETSYDNYWERNFEHNLSPDSYRTGLMTQSTEMRNTVIEREMVDAPYNYSYNLVREAYMRREIQKAITEGFAPDEIVVIVGAYHVEGVSPNLPPMTDQEFTDIPRTQSKFTLMPYSYYRLSSRTGYGAGNKAPNYFELMWDTMQKGNLDELPSIYLSKVARKLRESGFYASSASVIEAVRMAQALSFLKGSSQPVLDDLHQAIITCLGEGELSAVAEAINRIDIGTGIGYLPEGVSQTPLQEDLNLQLKKLKLSEYKSEVLKELSLDLRENLKVKSRAAAFIDLNRSTLLHRLNTIGIQFATKIKHSQTQATWAEKWNLRWTPEIEIQIVESNLKGETIEIAAAYVLKETLQDCTDIAHIASVIRKACECKLSKIFTNAINSLQALLVDANNFASIASAARDLSYLTQYGDIRSFDLQPLRPILQQLFLRGSLLLLSSSRCDDKAATIITKAINTMELISQEQYDLVDTVLWQNEIKKLAFQDDMNAKLSGIAFAILLEHNLIDEVSCEKEISRRLSQSVPTDIGAAWIEGLAARNRYALLSRIFLWKELDQFVEQLDEEEFKRSLVFLRRAFSDFEASQKNNIAELLADIWNVDAEVLGESLQDELTDDELDKLGEMNDFDFDF